MPKPAGSWIDAAACHGMDPETFFPLPGDTATINLARAVCAGCPVQQACLDWSIDALTDGIAGGMTAPERRKLKADTPPPPERVDDAAVDAILCGRIRYANARPVDRLEAIRRLTAAGVPSRDIANRFRIAQKSVQQVWHRHPETRAAAGAR